MIQPNIDIHKWYLGSTSHIELLTVGMEQPFPRASAYVHYVCAACAARSCTTFEFGLTKSHESVEMFICLTKATLQKSINNVAKSRQICERSNGLGKPLQ